MNLKYLFSAGVLSLGCSVYAQVLTFQEGVDNYSGAADNSIFEESENTNGGIEHLYVGVTRNDDIRRALIRFDVSSIPAGAVVESASLTVEVNQAVSGDLPHTLHRITSEWGEGDTNSGGAGGQGAPPEDGDVTWVSAKHNQETWTTPGGDFIAQASASGTIGDAGSTHTLSGQGLADDVQGWIDDPASNYGWILLGDETGTFNAKRLSSKEASESNVRPLLTVTLQQSTPTMTATPSPTPTIVPTTVTPTATATPTPTIVPTTVTPTATATPSPTILPTTITPTATATPTPTIIPTTVTPTATATPSPTIVPTTVTPTATATPTPTIVPTTGTPTATPTPTPTVTPTPTPTPAVDSDVDGLTDEEEAILGTNPNVKDTDGDGFEDGVEVAIGSDPLEALDPGDDDADMDGIPDSADNDTTSSDSDSDGFADYFELVLGSSPDDTLDTPSLADADGNGNVDNVDAILVMEVFLGLSTPGDLSGSIIDVNRNGLLDNVDAVIIFNWFLGNIDELPLI